VRFFSKIAFATALCLAALPLFAAEGVLIVQTTTNGAKTQTSQIQIEKDRMRTEMVGANGEQQAMVFDGAKQVLTIINLTKKTYSEITKADIDAMGAQLSDAMAQVQGRLAGLPPAQRAQIEAMMRGRGAPPAAPAAPPPLKTEYRKTGTDKVGKWTCDKYEGYMNGQKVSELCAVDPRALGLALSDFEITKQFATFFSGMMSQFQGRGRGEMFAIGSVESQGFSGVPVRHATYANGALQSTMELTDVSRQSFAASTYAVPSGFQKEAGFGGMGGRAGRP
jgi:hypothetical protein